MEVLGRTEGVIVLPIFSFESKERKKTDAIIFPEALRIVATMSHDGIIPTEDVKTALAVRFGVVIESQSQNAVSSSLIVADQYQALVLAITGEMVAMREQIMALHEQLEARNAQLEVREQSRDQQLVANLREVQEMRQEMQRPWWRKIFGLK